MSKRNSKNQSKRRSFGALTNAINSEETQMQDIYGMINAMLGEHIGSLTPRQQKLIYKGIKNKYNRGIDLNYLKTLLFPEYFHSDIPSPLTNLSYCKFDDKQDAIINTQGAAGAASGAGMIVWFPRVTSGPSLFTWGNAAGTLPTIAGQGIPFIPLSTQLDNSKWCGGFEQYYSNYFTQTQLVAAALSVQYIGQQEQESGMWVGGHIFGQSMDQLVVDDIENSQYVTRSRPNEGLRFVYLPSEGTDYEYYPTKIENAHNGGAEPEGGEATFTWNGKVVSSPFSNTGPRNLQGNTFTETYGGATTGPANDTITYISNTNYIAVYWSGFPSAQNWIRIDATRQFNGIPKQQYRNIMQVSRCKKNFNAQKTFDILRALCVTQASVGGHTLKDVDAQMDRIVEALPNVVEQMNGGMMQQTNSLNEMANMLESPTAESKGLVGPVQQSLSRVYPYA